ncbi:MAG: alpha/beta fold hydrolase [Burkholderiaceae bacterium]|jgi:arylformamidase|nr:alpha/beta fold hydrolase [Burkholderiaceae bacterium]
MHMRQTPEWYDRMYNNRAWVPDFANHLQHWTEQSKAARNQLRGLTDISYGDGPNENLDIFPANLAHAPVMVFLHGGYWRALDKSDQSFIAPSFTREGVCVVVPNYALCPRVTIPDIVMQMVKALTWVWRYISEWGGDPSRIHVVGHSAGGHLAAMMMACQWQRYADDLPADLVKSGLSVSGLFELESVMRSPMLQSDLRLDEAQVLRCSPAWMPTPAQGSFWSVVGALESDEFIRQHVLIQQAWGKACVPVCEALPGLHHFNVLSALAESGSYLNRLALRFLHGLM